MNLSHLETPKARNFQGDWYWTDFSEDGRRYRRPLPHEEMGYRMAQSPS